MTDDDEIMIIASSGKLIRIKASNISTIGRATQGVRLIDLAEEDKVVSVARLAEEDEEESGVEKTGAGKCLRLFLYCLNPNFRFY